jgi:hypothetical protein
MSIKTHYCDDAYMTGMCSGHSNKDKSQVVRIHTKYLTVRGPMLNS